MGDPKLYRASTVCEVTGIKAVTLRQWHLRGLYIPLSEHLPEFVGGASKFGRKPSPELVKAAKQVREARRQGWRLYTFEDIVRLLIMHRLVLLGLTAERAGLISKSCSVHGAQQWYAGHEMPERNVKMDMFDVAFLPEEDALKNVETLYGPPAMDRLIGHSVHTYLGREDLGNLVPKKDKLFSRDMGVFINDSAYVREVQAKLAAIEKWEQQRKDNA